MAEPQAQTEALKSAGYTVLDPDKIVETIQRLEQRIADRFPDAGLRKVCRQLLGIGREARRRSIDINRPIWPLRISTIVLVLLFISGLIIVFQKLPAPEEDVVFTNLKFLEVVEWTLNDVIYIGLAIVFLWTIERRLKRKRALAAIHELRSMAHIIDMHQLTKDPDQVLHPGDETESSPERSLTQSQLARYLDYCSELLSLVGKIAALYVQRFDDAVALAAVNEVENLTTGLSRKIWQKVMILDTGDGGGPGVS